MIQRFGHCKRVLLARKGLALMLAFWLNFALLPCAMALQVSESGHDCCPPTIEFVPSDCCELDDYSVDYRDGNDIGHVAVFDAPQPDFSRASQVALVVSPPLAPDDTGPPLYVQNCVYLK